MRLGGGSTRAGPTLSNLVDTAPFRPAAGVQEAGEELHDGRRQRRRRQREGGGAGVGDAGEAEPGEARPDRRGEPRGGVHGLGGGPAAGELRVDDDRA